METGSMLRLFLRLSLFLLIYRGHVTEAGRHDRRNEGPTCDKEVDTGYWWWRPTTYFQCEEDQFCCNDAWNRECCDEEPLNGAAIAGITVFLIVALLVAVSVSCVCYHKKKNTSQYVNLVHWYHGTGDIFKRNNSGPNNNQQTVSTVQGQGQGQVFTTTTQETFSHNRPMTMMTSEMPPAYTSRPGTQMGMERPGTMMNMTRPGTMETGMGSQHGAGGWVSQPPPGMTSSEENRTASSSTTSEFRTRTETPMHPPTWANKGTTKPSTLGTLYEKDPNGQVTATININQPAQPYVPGPAVYIPPDVATQQLHPQPTYNPRY